jgi:hypothetical protein
MSVRLSGFVFAVAIVAGCASDEDVLTYEEFKSQAYLEPDTGYYVLNGDELIENEALMEEAYERFLDSVAYAEAREAGLSTIEQPSIVNQVGGQDDVWAPSVAANLTYCVSQSSFGSRYSTVVSAMSSAAGAWESAAGAGLNFVHDSSQDGNCTNRNKNVVFNVRQVTSSQYLARAFFPSTGRRGREILIATSSFGNIDPWTLTGVLRHELGHTIGLRHEHTRPESGTCFEDNNWRALTAYDSESVMHYPQCNGTQDGDLVLTNSDKAGAAALY